MIVVTNQGRKWLWWAVRYPLSQCFINLYINDWVPTEEDTIDNYAPATFPGYQSYTLARWSYPYDNSDGNTVIASPIITWTQLAVPTPLQTIYGYTVSNSRNQLIYAELTEPTGYLLYAAPQIYQVRPALELGDIT